MIDLRVCRLFPPGFLLQQQPQHVGDRFGIFLIATSFSIFSDRSAFVTILNRLQLASAGERSL